MYDEQNMMDGAAEDDTSSDQSYQPTKEERMIRRKIYSRYQVMRGDPLRKAAEEEWHLGDAAFGQDIPVVETDDWRAHLVLPDAFAGIQASMQETIDRNSRPYLRRVEDSDRGIETFQNVVLTHNLNRTGFDFQYFLAKYSAGIRGTAYLMDYYRVDKRKVQDPTGVNPDGTLKYQDKEIVDFDDDYTEWVPNEWIFWDPNAKSDDEAIDMIKREVMDVDEFRRSYGFRKDFTNLEFVHRGGETTTQSPIFQFPHDLNENEVEILHYYNRAEDQYCAVANNVTVRIGPLPSKHKELPCTTIYHYMVPGRHYGLGIPKIIDALSQERASIRNLNLDRQKMQINKMYLVNSQVDFDDEDTITRPHGFIEVDTNGLPINQAIQPLEYGDVPASYFRTEEILLEDIRRAHGIDDRIQGVQTGGTATEASILKEQAQKRIGLIARLAEMSPLIRIGRLKWSNIQFLYPAPRVEKITEDNDDREKKVYKKIQADGQEFTIVKDSGTNQTSLQVNEIEGSSTFTLNPSMARYMEGDTDVVVDVESVTVVSKAIKQAKTSEMLASITAIPQFVAELDPRKALTEILEVNDFQAKNWLKGDGKSDEQWEEEAEWENMVMASGQPLSPTENAPTSHTEGHLNYTRTAEFQQLPEATKAIFSQHILGEHDANPLTGSSADLLGGGGAPAGGPPTPGIPGIPGGPGGPAAPQIQPADLTPSTVTGEAPNSSSNQ